GVSAGRDDVDQGGSLHPTRTTRLGGVLRERGADAIQLARGRAGGEPPGARPRDAAWDPGPAVGPDRLRATLRAVRAGPAVGGHAAARQRHHDDADAGGAADSAARVRREPGGGLLALLGPEHVPNPLVLRAEHPRREAPELLLPRQCQFGAEAPHVVQEYPLEHAAVLEHGPGHGFDGVPLDLSAIALREARAPRPAHRL